MITKVIKMKTKYRLEFPYGGYQDFENHKECLRAKSFFDNYTAPGLIRKGKKTV